MSVTPFTTTPTSVDHSETESVSGPDMVRNIEQNSGFVQSVVQNAAFQTEAPQVIMRPMFQAPGLVTPDVSMPVIPTVEGTRFTTYHTAPFQKGVTQMEEEDLEPDLAASSDITGQVEESAESDSALDSSLNTSDSTIQSGPGQYVCGLCHKTFPVPSRLKVHLMKHRGEKPHKCEVCSKRFLRSGDFKRHKKIHERPYTCSTCFKGFKEEQLYNAHIESHRCEATKTLSTADDQFVVTSTPDVANLPTDFADTYINTKASCDTAVDLTQTTRSPSTTDTTSTSSSLHTERPTLPNRQPQLLAAVPQLSVINVSQHMANPPVTAITPCVVSGCIEPLTSQNDVHKIDMSTPVEPPHPYPPAPVNDILSIKTSLDISSVTTTVVNPSIASSLAMSQDSIQMIPVSSLGVSGITFRVPVSPRSSQVPGGTTIQQLPLASLPPNIQCLLSGSGNIRLQAYKTSSGHIIATPNTSLLPSTRQIASLTNPHVLSASTLPSSVASNVNNSDASSMLSPLPSAPSLSDAVMKLPTVHNTNLVYSVKSPGVATTKSVSSSLLKTALDGSPAVVQIPGLQQALMVNKTPHTAVGSGLLAVRSGGGGHATTVPHVITNPQMMPGVNAAQTITVNTSTQPILTVKVPSAVSPLTVNTSLTTKMTPSSNTPPSDSLITHICEKCGSSFDSSYSLKVHMLIHRGGSPSKCVTCGKEFLFRSDLERHSVEHPGSKPFKCMICGNGFQLGSSLKRHMFIHTGRPGKSGTTAVVSTFDTTEATVTVTTLPNGPLSADGKDALWNDDPKVSDLEAYVRMHIQKAMADKNYGKEVPMRRRYSYDDKGTSSHDGDYESNDDCDESIGDESSSIVEMTHIERLSRKSGSTQAICMNSTSCPATIPTFDAGTIIVTVPSTKLGNSIMTESLMVSATHITSPSALSDSTSASPMALTSLAECYVMDTSTVQCSVTAIPMQQLSSDTIDITSESSLAESSLAESSLAESSLDDKTTQTHACETCGEVFTLISELESHLQSHLGTVVPDGLISIHAEDISLLDMAQHPTQSEHGIDKEFSEFVDLERYVESTEEALLNINQPPMSTSSQSTDLISSNVIEPPKETLAAGNVNLHLQINNRIINDYM